MSCDDDNFDDLARLVELFAEAPPEIAAPLAAFFDMNGRLADPNTPHVLGDTIDRDGRPLREHRSYAEAYSFVLEVAPIAAAISARHIDLMDEYLEAVQRRQETDA
jgi:hypothetical protein